MVQRILTLTEPFKKPFNIVSPMGRGEYWTFYAGFMVVSAVSILFLSQVEKISAGSGLGTVISLSGSLWLLYLLLVFFAASARRMADSGYWRIALLLAVGSASGTLGFLIRDILSVWSPGVPVPQAGVAVIYSRYTFGFAFATIASMFYVFLGLVRPTKMQRPSPDPEDVSAPES